MTRNSHGACGCRLLPWPRGGWLGGLPFSLFSVPFALGFLTAALAGVTKLDGHAYDWTLNDAEGSGG